MGALKNAQYERFAHEYLVDYNMTQAAIRAGYSEKSARSTGPVIMKNPAVLARVKELQAEQTERLCITQDWVLHRLVKVTDKALQAEPVMVFNPSTRQMEPSGEYVFDSRGANRALELLGKHLGMFDAKQVNKEIEDLSPLADMLKP